MLYLGETYGQNTMGQIPWTRLLLIPCKKTLLTLILVLIKKGWHMVLTHGIHIECRLFKGGN